MNVEYMPFIRDPQVYQQNKKFYICGVEGCNRRGRRLNEVDKIRLINKVYNQPKLIKIRYY
jgi:hypothetical protein